MATGDDYRRLYRPRDQAVESDGLAPAFPNLNYDDETALDSTAAAAPPRETGDSVQWNGGTAFVNGIVEYLELPGKHDL